MSEAKRRHNLGSGPIEERYRRDMNKLAQTLDMIFNGPPTPNRVKKTGYVLMVFPFDGDIGRCNYISNAERQDVITLLKEQLRYFEGQPEPEERGIVQ